MFVNLAVSGGAHLCVPFLGFVRAAAQHLSGVRNVCATSGGALVGLAFVLDIPHDAVLDIVLKYFEKGLAQQVDVVSLVSEFGLVNTEEFIGPMVRELLATGVNRWKLLKRGWAPARDDTDPARLTLAELAKLTGINFVVTACDAARGFDITYLSPDTHPDATVVSAICASCAVPLIFSPVTVQGSDGLFVDGCVRDNCPSRYFDGDDSGAGGSGGSSVVVDTLSLDVRVFGGDEVEGPKDALPPRNVLEYGKALMTTLIQNSLDSAPPARCMNVLLPRWTDKRIEPLMFGFDAAEVADAYRHGLAQGASFAAKI